jgi:hypothetical protein
MWCESKDTIMQHLRWFPSGAATTSWIRVDGLPIVPEGRQRDKLLNTLHQFFRATATVVDDGIDMPSKQDSS